MIFENFYFYHVGYKQNLDSKIWGSNLDILQAD
jgi:hypothetical protein